MKRKEWYETWFDSPYYHILYQHRDEEEAELLLNNLLTYLHPYPNASVLDVACGKGRHAVYLAGKGLFVTGIDLSWKNMSHARKYESDHLSFFVHDMRNIFYINYFDVVFNLFTSFGYFETETENLKAIHSMSLSLKKGGRLVVDFFNSEKITREIIPQEFIMRDGILFLTKKNFEKGNIIKKIYFQDRGQEYEFEERVQMLQRQDFERYFEKNHLKIKDVFGDYHLNPFDKDQSERMIIVGEKY